MNMSEKEENRCRRKEADELFSWSLNRIAKLDVEYDKLIAEDKAKDIKLPQPM
jgi:hypothetical protein